MKIWTNHAYIVVDCDKCKKVYTTSTLEEEPEHVISRDIFNIIKSGEFNSFGKLYEYEYNSTRRQITSYTMRYYFGKLINILHMPTSYTTLNFDLIYDDIVKLSKYRIIAEDMHCKNVIYNDTHMIVIDFDNFRISNDSEEVVLNTNIEILLRLFKSLYMHYLYKEMYHSRIDNGINNLIYLFEREEDQKKAIKVKLRGCDRPINYFKRSVK